MEISLLTDLTLACEDAKFAQPEIKLAHMAPIAINLLPLITGSKKAMELIITGETLNATEALHLNLVNKVFNIETFENDCNDYIKRILGLSQAAIKARYKSL